MRRAPSGHEPHTVGTREHDHGRRGWSPAQWFRLVGGLTLVAAGLLGFISDATFDTSTSVDTDTGGNADGQLQGDGFLGFEVNGWHNLVHLGSGLLLLVGIVRHGLARTVALVFGVVYVIVTIIGLIDGNDILGILPINPADNILHAALALIALFVALSARDRSGDRTPGRDHDRSREVLTDPPPSTSAPVAGDRDERFTRAGERSTVVEHDIEHGGPSAPR